MQYRRQSVTHSIRSAFEIRRERTQACDGRFITRASHGSHADVSDNKLQRPGFGFVWPRINLAVFMCRPFEREKAASGSSSRVGRRGGEGGGGGRARATKASISDRILPLKKGGIRLVNGRAAEDCSSVGYIRYACPGRVLFLAPPWWSFFFQGLNREWKVHLVLKKKQKVLISEIITLCCVMREMVVSFFFIYKYRKFERK